MNSKIRVEYDFDTKEPYIQIYLEESTDGQPDMRDGMLKNLIEQARNGGIYVSYPSVNSNRSTPQLRLGNFRDIQKEVTLDNKFN